MTRLCLRVVPVALLLAACATDRRPADRAELKPRFDIHQVVSPELLRQANHGRNVVGTDGRFVMPQGVRRAWIDVGAHLMEWTRAELERSDDIALVAIEPLAECWKVWPDNTRLIALPVAIATERGSLDFNVNAENATSSLLKSAAGTFVSEQTRTVEVRKVPVLRLEDVLERIPPEIDVEYLKSDVQGLDLQVLKSGGEQLRRVARVKAEVIVERLYEGSGEFRQGTAAEFVSYMQSQGFEFERDSGDYGAWLDKAFVNPQRLGWLARARRYLRSRGR